ncbi:MAG: undecaprenyl diphosphate synthase family protein, partial [Dehalococcoidia bacterium]
EFYSTPVWWPDFQGDHIDQALEAFSGRKRRFGKRV